MLPARHRLTRPADFAAVVRGILPGSGRAAVVRARVGSPLVVVHAAAVPARAGQPPRVGFVVSKAVGRAVVRNRTKRVLRALVASRLPGIPDGCDVVVRAQPAAAGVRSAVVDEQLGQALHRAVERLAARARR
ncbi:MAG TPA: ribonuclease P protein component [Dermatophilaceae bacterium]|nr:ribonuclease P protein component [Dermatophilaceae bacterium]